MKRIVFEDCNGNVAETKIFDSEEKALYGPGCMVPVV